MTRQSRQQSAAKNGQPNSNSKMHSIKKTVHEYEIREEDTSKVQVKNFTLSHIESENESNADGSRISRLE